MSSKNSNEKWLIYVKSDNRKVVIGADKVEIITELFDSVMERNKQSATHKQPMKGSNFVFDYTLRDYITSVIR